MMAGTRGFRLLAAALLALLLSGAAAEAAGSDAGGERRLVLRDGDGATLLSLPDPGCFAIRYIHSVALSPVEDWFAVVPGGVELRRSVYRDFGAGLPHEPGPGQVMTFGDGCVILDGLRVFLPSLDVRVGRVARHALLWDDASGVRREAPLADLAAPGRAVTIVVVPADGAAGTELSEVKDGQ